MELGLSLGFGRREEEEEEERSSGEPPVQLSLLPPAPVPARYHSSPPSSSSSSSSSSSAARLGFPWAANNNNLDVPARGFDVNLLPPAEEAGEGSHSSAASSFPAGFSATAVGPGQAAAPTRSEGEEPERASPRASDEENATATKKLRLSKEQSAFLEESFREHSTLNSRQKVELARQLNLRPRQVEVWFQNRRARTKLKQTEVDCRHLRRCCEALADENRRLRKELSDLRALKAPSSRPFFMQPPATTLSMCPSCERTAAAANGAGSGGKPADSFAPPSGKPRLYRFLPQPATSPAS